MCPENTSDIPQPPQPPETPSETVTRVFNQVSQEFSQSAEDPKQFDQVIDQAKKVLLSPQEIALHQLMVDIAQAIAKGKPFPIGKTMEELLAAISDQGLQIVFVDTNQPPITQDQLAMNAYDQQRGRSISLEETEVGDRKLHIQHFDEEGQPTLDLNIPIWRQGTGISANNPGSLAKQNDEYRVLFLDINLYATLNKYSLRDPFHEFAAWRIITPQGKKEDIKTASVDPKILIQKDIPVSFASHFGSTHLIDVTLRELTN